MNSTSTTVVAATMAGEAPVTSHPSPCPPWCKERGHRLNHHFGPSSTWHWSPQYHLANAWANGDDASPLMRAELARCDEDDKVGGTSMFVQGEREANLSAAEADIFIAHLQAFVDTLRVLRSQMGDA